jgi:membrane protease subunit (stomatin/prohibitin family)
VAGDAMGLGAGMALGQILAQNMQNGFQNHQQAAPAPVPAPAPTPAPAPVQQSADDIIAMLEKIGNLKAKGILSEEEFAIKKAELLKKLG